VLYRDRLAGAELQIPYVEPVQVEVSPLLRLPPVLALTLKRVFFGGVDRLRDSLEKDGAPA
jgi:hypothetical protein